MRIKRAFAVLFFCFHAAWAAKMNTLAVGVPEKQYPYWSSSSGALGAIVLVNGEGQNMGMPFNHALAEALSQKGYSVVLMAYNERIEQDIPQALSLLRQNGASRLVLLHYGGHLLQSIRYFSQPQTKRLDGLILLSAYDAQGASSPVALLRAIHYPTYDVWGQFEFFRIIKQAKARKNALRAQSNYTPFMFPGARHGYPYALTNVVGYLSAWMKKLPEQDKRYLPKSPF